MAHTLKVKPNDDVLGWLVFIDRRPITGFNRDFEAPLILSEGEHRLAVDVRGAGGAVEVTIDGAAVLTDPAGGWPLKVKVPATETGRIIRAEFSS